MKFFEIQKTSRRNTIILVVLFIIGTTILAILNAIILSVLLKFYSATSAKHHYVDPFHFNVMDQISDPFFVKVFVYSLIIFLVTTFLSLMTVPSPTELAQKLGGIELRRVRTDEERKIRNVVEEMSIASGVPIPRIFILEDSETINAFAAGTNPNEMIIGVTKGAIENLTRDELQAVIGHEFSHILNEDMNLNIKISAVLIAFFLFMRFGLRIIQPDRKRSTALGRGKNDDAAVLIGIVLIIFGFVGFIFGRIIQSIISREREYLADASSAQFTRNPEGLASALAKTKMGSGSIIKSASEIEFAHIFFAEGIPTSFANIFATHPRIADRIKRLIPKYDVEIFMRSVMSRTQDLKTDKMQNDKLYLDPLKDLSRVSAVIGSVGAPSLENLNQAKKVIKETNAIREYLCLQQNAIIALKLIALRSQSEGSAAAEKLKDECDDQSVFFEIKNVVFAGNDIQRSNIFQWSLLTLREGQISQKIEIINQLRAIFLQDQTLSLFEGLILLNMELLLTPAANNKKVPTLEQQQVLDRVLSYANSPELTSMEDLYKFASCFKDSSMLKKKEIVSQLELAFLGKSHARNEEFRLLCLALKVPVPIFNS